MISMKQPGPRSPWLWVIRTRDEDFWHVVVAPGTTNQHPVADDVAEVAVSAVTRDGREGVIVRMDVMTKIIAQ